jgi:hypothetical protein
MQRGARNKIELEPIMRRLARLSFLLGSTLWLIDRGSVRAVPCSNASLCATNGTGNCAVLDDFRGLQGIMC